MAENVVDKMSKFLSREIPSTLKGLRKMLNGKPQIKTAEKMTEEYLEKLRGDENGI